MFIEPHHLKSESKVDIWQTINNLGRLKQKQKCNYCKKQR